MTTICQSKTTARSSSGSAPPASLRERSPWTAAHRSIPVASITSELAALFQLSREEGVVVSRRLQQSEPRLTGEDGETIRIDGSDSRVAGAAPEWLEGLYLGRPIDIWMPLRETSLPDAERSGRSFWVIARLRAGTAIDRAEALINAGRRDAANLRVFQYTGMTPEMAGGLSRIGSLLRSAAAAVFLVACANVACLLLSRASARSQETAVRVALGARRGQLARQLLSDSVLIAVAGGASGMVLAMWTTNLVPLLFFDKDAAQLVFAPDLRGIVAAAAACITITVACGLAPFFEIRDDRPATVLQRENAGPSKPMRRLRTGLVVAQMTLCCMLVIATGLLLEIFRSAQKTDVGNRLGEPILASIMARPASSRTETTASGLRFFRAVDDTVQSVPGVTPLAWVSTLPGSLPAWQQFRVEPSELPVRDETMDVIAFTPASLAQVTVPPLAGRMFGSQDLPQACRVAIVNEAAARDVFGGDAVGRSIDDPAGQKVEVVGVVATRRAEGTTDPIRPTIFYYADQTSIPVAAPGPARFRVPTPLDSSTVALDSNVVSAGYFDAMGWTMERGSVFSDNLPRGCRVGVVNREAAELYFGGNALGAAVIDLAGRRTEIIGVVRAEPIRNLQRRIEPSIYFPMAQDFLLGMTGILNAHDSSDTVVANLRRKLEAVPDRGPAPVVVRTLESHLSDTALTPLRIATVLVGASAVTALALGVLGLYGAITDSARWRRREIAVRIALGAQGWRVIRQVASEGARLACAGTIAGMLGSMLVPRALARIAPHVEPLAVWVWLAGPLVLIAAVVVASVLPAFRALAIDPITITRADT